MNLLTRRCKTGKFTQLAVSSVLKDSSRNRQAALSRASDYGAKLADLEPDFSPDTRDARRQILMDEKPFVEHFEYADNGGFAMLSVTEEDVQIEIHDGLGGDKPWKTISLSKLIG